MNLRFFNLTTPLWESFHRYETAHFQARTPCSTEVESKIWGISRQCSSESPTSQVQNHSPRAFGEELAGVQYAQQKAEKGPGFNARRSTIQKTMPREVLGTSRGLLFPHKLPQNRRVTAFHSAVLSVLQRKQKPLKKPKILRKSSRLFSAFQDPGPTPSLALKMQ